MVYPINALTARQIAQAVGGEIVKGNGEMQISSISCDSRTVQTDTLFIPIKGEKFDGHNFLGEVCAKNIGGYLTAKQISGDAPFVIRVEDTSKALLDLAAYYRRMYNLPVVGLTGSVGKTTTKEFIASVLSEKYSVLATKGNFNNNIGVPYTIFGLNNSHNAAVIEMGMSNFGEIEVLSKCVAPDIAIITNIGTSHIEYLGSQEGILRAKSEIFEGLAPCGRVILNGDDPYLLSLKGKIDYPICYVGIKNAECDYVAKGIQSDEHGCKFTVSGKEFVINLAGVHNIYNALCSIAVGEMLDMDYDQIFNGLKKYHSDGIRQNIISANGFKLINDCYNSSAQSAIAALDVLTTVECTRTIAVLGDIAELGDKSEELHRMVGKAVRESDVNVLVTVGNQSQYIADEAYNKEVYSFSETSDAAKFLKNYICNGDAVLVKGSRCMKMEQISKILI